RQRMAAAGLLEAIEQRLLARLEEDHGRVEAAVRQVVEGRLQLVEVGAAARVGNDRGPPHVAPRVSEELAERADHPRRQVVDAEIARVLERRHGLGLAGARVAGDEDELYALGHPVRLSWRWMSRASLPGMPGTASSSSRLARATCSGEPKWSRRARFRAGPTPGSSSSSERRSDRSRRLRWNVIANLCASSRTRW